jgi:ATP-dependent helicase YprA (DUF1998 family)
MLRLLTTRLNATKKVGGPSFLIGGLITGANGRFKSTVASELNHLDDVVQDDVPDISVEPTQHELQVAYQHLHSIHVSGRDSHEYLPWLSFDSTPFHKKLKKTLKDVGYTDPTPTQAQSWSILGDGRDLISVARTGAGKTCGFLLPAFQRLLNDPPTVNNKFDDMNNGNMNDFNAGFGIEGEKYARETGERAKDGVYNNGRIQPRIADKIERLRRTVRSRTSKSPRILVLAPTRELTKQIEAEARKFGKPLGKQCLAVYGGAPKHGQIRSLRVGVDMVVATPGRCYDLMQEGSLKTSNIEYLVCVLYCILLYCILILHFSRYFYSCLL